ncbi:MAG TPA: heme-binding protein [Acidobacteriaceae bacterium]|nr:heme-binding protein [Acidobacteriaceae bacterium]
MSPTASPRVSDVRIAPDNQTVLKQLGLLQDLAGTWKGRGLNLIARPDFHDGTDLYLQVNETRETTQFTPIGSAIPNRGFGQDDIELFGLTYLQKISDAAKDGALHIEPGIWVTQPPTTFPAESNPNNGQIVARMGTIPHGNSLLAQGEATPFSGPPVVTAGGSQYSFSLFPSFNSTPFAVPPTAPGVVFNAAGSSEKLTAPTVPAPTPPPFPMYDVSVPIGPIPLGPFNPPFTLNTRTPYETNPAEPPLPASINGIAMQEIVNDPIVLLAGEIQQQVKDGFSFEGVALNIASQATVTFLKNANSGAAGPTVAVSVPQFGGGIENIQFLNGVATTGGTPPAPEQVENAQTAVVYATFWIERLTHPKLKQPLMQLQYAQMVLLDFPIFHLLNPPKTTPPTPAKYVNLGWPHISVATLRKTFD